VRRLNARSDPTEIRAGFSRARWNYLSETPPADDFSVASRKRSGSVNNPQRLLLFRPHRCALHTTRPSLTDVRYDTTRDAILACARKLTQVNLIYRTVGGVHSGRTLVSGWRTFPALRPTCGRCVTTNVGKPSATGQSTRPTQPFILSGSINE